MTDEKLIAADLNARKWLERMNRLDERGITGPKLEEAERKAQYWMDRFTKLNGDA